MKNRYCVWGCDFNTSVRLDFFSTLVKAKVYGRTVIKAWSSVMIEDQEDDCHWTLVGESGKWKKDK